jgi:hypothetical protein
MYMFVILAILQVYNPEPSIKVLNPVVVQSNLTLEQCQDLIRTAAPRLNPKEFVIQCVKINESI